MQLLIKIIGILKYKVFRLDSCLQTSTSEPRRLSLQVSVKYQTVRGIPDKKVKNHCLTLSRLRRGLWTKSKIKSWARGPTSPSEAHPGGKFMWHFACGFRFRHYPRLPFAAVLSVLKGLIIVPMGTMGPFFSRHD